jgi:hypothetical protein
MRSCSLHDKASWRLRKTNSELVLPRSLQFRSALPATDRAPSTARAEPSNFIVLSNRVVERARYVCHEDSRHLRMRKFSFQFLHLLRLRLGCHS